MLEYLKLAGKLFSYPYNKVKGRERELLAKANSLFQDIAEKIEKLEECLTSYSKRILESINPNVENETKINEEEKVEIKSAFQALENCIYSIEFLAYIEEKKLKGEIKNMINYFAYALRKVKEEFLSPLEGSLLRDYGDISSDLYVKYKMFYISKFRGIIYNFLEGTSIDVKNFQVYDRAQEQKSMVIPRLKVRER